MARPNLKPRRLGVLPLLLLLSFTLAGQAQAQAFLSGNGGPTFVYLTGDNATPTYAYQASARWGYQYWDTRWSLGLGVDAYRIKSGGKLSQDLDGNNGRLIVGYSGDEWNTWLAGGAGEIRSYDRENDDDRPYRYYVTSAEWGVSYNFYKADYALVDFNLVLKHMQPDQEWQDKFKMKTIETLQLGVGFKLINW